jgi:D-alanyl-D-alanine dipeptidase
MYQLLISVLYSIAALQSPDDFDVMMRKYNLVDITTLDSSIRVDLKYSSTDNFMGVDMYGSLDKAYLERDFANRVVKAQRILQERYPEYTLLIYDAARPISVQRTMRKSVEGTEFERFVADGTRGGRHNYGVAVDLTIATLDGTPLDMGAGFDDFTVAASVKGTPDNADPRTRTLDIYRNYVNAMAERGVISHEAAHNRMLLIEVMHAAGLYPYRNEWWHFEEIISISATREQYKLLDF